jgi:hypothetical protein
MRQLTQLGIMGAAMALHADPIMGHTRAAQDAWSRPRKPFGKDRSKAKAARKQRRKTNTI